MTHVVTPVGASGSCIALLELASIAAGLEVVDALLKQAEVELLLCRAVSPGKYVVLFSGEVDAVSSSLRRAVEVGDDVLIDRLFIPNVEPTLLQLVRRAVAGPSGTIGLGDGGGDDSAPGGSGALTLDALGIIETLSIASIIRAGDVASKLASLTLVSLELARGIGGKSYVTFTGQVSDVDAGVTAGAADAEAAGLLVRRVVIARPHEAMLAVLRGGPLP